VREEAIVQKKKRERKREILSWEEKKKLIGEIIVQRDLNEVHLRDKERGGLKKK
jgi:hypothetical protein